MDVHFTPFLVKDTKKTSNDKTSAVTAISADGTTQGRGNNFGWSFMHGMVMFLSKIAIQEICS